MTRRALYLVVFTVFLAALAVGGMYLHHRAASAKAAAGQGAKTGADCDTPAPKPAPPPPQAATPPPPFALEAGCGAPQTSTPPRKK